MRLNLEIRIFGSHTFLLKYQSLLCDSIFMSKVSCLLAIDERNLMEPLSLEEQNNFLKLKKKKVKSWYIKLITKTRPCNIQRFFSVVKIEKFTRKNLIFLMFSLKTYTVGTR